MSETGTYIKGSYLARELMGTWDVYRDGRRVRMFPTRDEAVAWIDAHCKKVN